MKKLKVAIKGQGRSGRDIHGAFFKSAANECYNVVAVVDALAERRERAANEYGCDVYGDYRELFMRDDLDLVVNSTFSYQHAPISIDLLEHGLNVVCEKPMTTTVEEAAKLRAFAEEKGLINAMNFNCRFYPMAYRMRQMVRSGEAGGIYTVHGGYLQDWLYYDTDYSWRLEPEASGESRAFADIGSHWIDLVEFITGLRVRGPGGLRDLPQDP